MLEAQAHARAVSERLRNPPNAVKDCGITMKNGWPVEIDRRVVIPIHHVRNSRRVKIFYIVDWKQEFLDWQDCDPLNDVDGPTVEKIQLVVCDWYGIRLSEMLSPRRERRIVLPRQVAMFLSVEKTPLSLIQIGRRFRRDHTTVISAIRKIKTKRETDPSLNAAILELNKRL